MSADALKDLHQEDWFQKLSKAIEKSMDADQDIVSEPMSKDEREKAEEKEI